MSLRIAILDQQVVDSDNLPFARVDDLELDVTTPSPRAIALRCSQEALGTRLGGLVGELLGRTARRLRAAESPAGGFVVAPPEVEQWEPVLRVRSKLADLDAAPLEKWLSTRLVRRLPGATDAGE
ncbi:MAG: hypothetical protein M3237_16795 [Actinomycetota bacterium]|nr:hypothetical protein [Actinomycetota bacterium]